MSLSETWWAWRDWLTQHPDWILLLILGLAALEAVAVIGSIIPAVPIMLALTLLAGNADLPLQQVMLAAMLGAMLGDGISYAIGHHFKHRIEGVWPFRSHPQWLAASEAFVEKHGGKSLIFGRFIGPIRAFVPMAAGIFQMPFRRFIWFNFISAVAWAPPNILPGYIAGAAVSNPYMPGRYQLAFVGGLLIAVALLLWLLPWLKASTRRWRQSHAPRNDGLYYAADDRPENQMLSGLFALFGLAGFIAIALSLPALHDWDRAIAHELMHLRQPAIDYLFLVFTLLGDRHSLLTLGALLGIWLAARRQWRTLAFLALIAVACATLPNLLKLCFQVPRPRLVAHDLDSWAFPSAHAFNATLIWGFLYVMVSRQLHESGRAWALGVSLTIILFTAVSRVFLGMHWSTDVIAGLSLGLAMLALLRAVWYRGDGLRGLPAWEAPAVILAALVITS
ncbi:MAG: bifunctional DedA family/phosphatase PAP2 family protein, partial [Perlucidibaca sp.]